MGRRQALGSAGRRLYNEPRGKTVIFETSFATNNFTEFNSCQWTGRNDNCQSYNGTSNYSAAVTSVDGRAHVARFEVRDGDVPPFGGGERAEIAELDGGAGDVGVGDERWFAFDLKFESGMPNPTGGWFLPWQLHPESGTGSPPLCLDIDSDGVMFLANNNATGYQRSNAGAIVKGVWRRYVIHAKFSSDPGVGFHEMWIDGTQVVAKTFCRTMIAGDTFNYMKLGIYRDGANTSTQILYHDNLLITAP